MHEVTYFFPRDTIPYTIPVPMIAPEPRKVFAPKQKMIDGMGALKNTKINDYLII